jgi:ATP-dependent Lon protease
VLLPQKNEKDVRELKEEALEGIEIVYADRMRTVLDDVLEAKPVADPETLFDLPESEKPRYAPAE